MPLRAKLVSERNFSYHFLLFLRDESAPQTSSSLSFTLLEIQLFVQVHQPAFKTHNPHESALLKTPSLWDTLHCKAPYWKQDRSQTCYLGFIWINARFWFVWCFNFPVQIMKPFFTQRWTLSHNHVVWAAQPPGDVQRCLKNCTGVGRWLLQRTKSLLGFQCAHSWLRRVSVCPSSFCSTYS